MTNAMTRRRAVLFAILGCLVAGTGPVLGQHADHGAHSGADQTAAPAPTLQAPGQAVFGTVQEAIRALEADSTTDWSAVDVDRLRRHLIDMQHVALHVAVKEKAPIDGGVRIRARPTTDAARASLGRVLDAHPHMLKQETGWTMSVEAAGDAFVLRVTTEEAEEIDKIRALGYMGLLAYGAHHQRHHWDLVRGHTPDAHE